MDRRSVSSGGFVVAGYDESGTQGRSLRGNGVRRGTSICPLTERGHVQTDPVLEVSKQEADRLKS